MNPHDDLSCEELGRFALKALAAAVVALGFMALAAAFVALGFMGALFWTLSATPSSPSLIGTGANATLGDTAPVPAFSQEMRRD